jgi:N-ethylmaleimide reductase
MSTLFESYRLGNLELSNRVVMAPMTRSRAIGNIPNALMAEYYAQRSGAGLIITEGTSPSPNGLGYARIPGIYSAEQMAAWKQVTSAVHEKGGKIFVQLMHTGRITHPLNLPAGGKLLAPSAVKPETTTMWVDGHGTLQIPVPQEMTGEDIEDTILEFVHAATNAIAAGFDGIEIHAANGYLIKQFLNPHTNKRTDEYGGSIENRSRLLVEIVKQTSAAIGSEKVGVRLSPGGVYNETPLYPESDATYLYLAEKLNQSNIAYLHIFDQSSKGVPLPLVADIRQVFKGTIILAGGFDLVKAQDAARDDRTLVAFGKPFISNPDLVDRLRNKFPLNQPKFDLLYTPDEKGYSDYPVFNDVQVIA